MVPEPKIPPNVPIAQAVFRRMMGNISEGRWPMGAEIPSERALIHEFGASRIAIREAMSMLRGLGVLNVGRGRRTRVCQMGAETLGQLVPVMMMSGGQALFEHVFQIRLALETMAARLAASNGTETQISRLQELAELYRVQAEEGSDDVLKTDMTFHTEVARASGNPLFSMLLEALSGFVFYSQRESRRNDNIRIQRAVVAHKTIAEAIAARDGGWAAAEMEAHLQFSRAHRYRTEFLSQGSAEIPPEISAGWKKLALKPSDSPTSEVTSLE